MLAHGFTIAQMVGLVRAGLATVTPQRIRAGRETMEVTTAQDGTRRRDAPVNDERASPNGDPHAVMRRPRSALELRHRVGGGS
jgi:hypothetical protein